MRRALGVMLVAMTLWTKAAHAGNDITETPDVSGDQVIFYYDARPDFTTFITLRNYLVDEPMTVDVLFYGPAFGTPFRKPMILPPSSVTTIDVGALRDSGLPAEAGVAIATSVDSVGRPISLHSLAGRFTVANLLTGSAFGTAAAARSALNEDGTFPPFATLIGPATRTLQLIQPQTAVLAAFFDPATLAPVAAGGNQLIFISFTDVYGAAYTAASATTTWSVFAVSRGAALPGTTFTANGVTVSDLASVVGPSVNGAAGSIVFDGDTDSPTINRLIYFTEALGTFGTGYLLPPFKLRAIANN